MAHVKRLPNIFNTRESTSFKNKTIEGLSKFGDQDERISSMNYWAHYEPNEVFSTFPFLDESRYMSPQLDTHIAGLGCA